MIHNINSSYADSLSEDLLSTPEFQGLEDFVNTAMRVLSSQIIRDRIPGSINEFEMCYTELATKVTQNFILRDLELASHKKFLKIQAIESILSKAYQELGECENSLKQLNFDDLRNDYYTARRDCIETFSKSYQKQGYNPFLLDQDSTEDQIRELAWSDNIHGCAIKSAEDAAEIALEGKKITWMREGDWRYRFRFHQIDRHPTLTQLEQAEANKAKIAILSEEIAQIENHQLPQAEQEYQEAQEKLQNYPSTIGYKDAATLKNDAIEAYDSLIDRITNIQKCFLI